MLTSVIRLALAAPPSRVSSGRNPRVGVSRQFCLCLWITLIHNQIQCFKPELSLSERGLRETMTQINQVFKKEYWQEANRFDKLMVHAETLCQALSYCETLKVLAKHAVKDPARGDLYHRYLKLVTPRFAAIYADWKV